MMTDGPWNTEELSALDKRYVWHPFTPMRPWCADDHEPLFLVKGEGVWLWDSRGNKYLDGNSSIWTNIHGHGHPRIVDALRRQAGQLAHSSFLGSSNPWAVELAAALCAFFPCGSLDRVFYTDDGSTAIECALKMAIQFRQQNGEPERVRFAAFANAYHGDTMGAASLGGVEAFFVRFQSFGMKPLRLGSLDDLHSLPAATVRTLTAVVIEPLIQGVNRMALWPKGMLAELRAWCDANGVFLILDEVMTGFGRTGKMFACQHEDVIPDFLCLAKGITGGTVPLAATLTTSEVFNGFLGNDSADHTFYYGHSYCGNPMGCAAALASLDVFKEEKTLELLPDKERVLDEALAGLRDSFPDHVRETRRLGMIAAIDVVQAGGSPWPADARMGARVCSEARKHGLLTRPVFDTLVLMPPLSISADEILFMANALGSAMQSVFKRDYSQSGP